MDDTSKNVPPEDNVSGMITTETDVKPKVSLVEFSMVVGVFALCLISMLVLYLCPRDWNADDEKHKKQTIQVMKELYAEMFLHMQEYETDSFPIEIDNFLRQRPLEKITLGICPASHRRFSIQIIPGWKKEDVEENPNLLLAYDYNEDELRLKDLNWARITVKKFDEELGEETDYTRALTYEEKAAIVAHDFSMFPNETEEDEKHVKKLKALYQKYITEATLGRNFQDGHVVLFLNGEVEFVSDAVFCQHRLRIFHRELVKMAHLNKTVFPRTAVDAVVTMFEKDEILQTWWLKNSLGIDPGYTEEFIGYKMNPNEVKLSDAPNTVLMFDKKSSNHPMLIDGKKVNGRNVLFLDGTVRYIPETEFDVLFDKITSSGSDKLDEIDKTEKTDEPNQDTDDNEKPEESGEGKGSLE